MRRGFVVSLIALGVGAVLAVYLISRIGPADSKSVNSRFRMEIPAISGGEYDYPAGGGMVYHHSQRFCVLIGDGYYGLVELSWQPATGPRRFDTAFCIRRGIFSLRYPAPVAASLIGGCILLIIGVLSVVLWCRNTHARPAKQPVQATAS
jgi:hypothetical protein